MKTTPQKIILIALISLISGYAGGRLAGANSLTNGALKNTSVQREVISSEGDLVAQIASEVGQSVVSIETEQTTQVDNIFFGPQSRTSQSAGTGIIVSDKGYVMTNKHVIPSNATSVTVTLSDGTKYKDVEVIGRDPANDVAYLKIKEPKNLKPAKIADSSLVKVGQKVIAIGNAQGRFQNTVTQGIVSGLGRDIVASDGSATGEQLSNLLQTDAAINSGNSGGPLINLNGEVVGINTAVAGNAENLGFVIPVNDIKGGLTGVLESGKLVRGYLGVKYLALTDDIAYELNLPVKRGAYIAPSRTSTPPIIKDSPAEKAGLQVKDIITKVGDTDISEKTSLASALGKFKVGSEVELTIYRDGKEQKLKVTLEELKQ
jgi:serine protease Do